MNRIFTRALMNIGVLIIVTVLWFWNTSESVLYSSPPPPDQTTTVNAVGKSIYLDRCSMCHGMTGKGDGFAAPNLNPRPRDLASGKFKFRSTESGSIPTDDDLRQTVLNGLHGTSMPDWKPFITGDSLTTVIEYIKSFSPRFANEQAHPVKMGPEVLSSPASISAGKKMYDKLQCASCHGSDGVGKNAVAVDLVDDGGKSITATNLNEPWNFRGGSSAKDIYLRFRTGIDGTPMPSYIGSASDQEMWNLANYVVSMARKPVWEMNEREIKEYHAGLDGKNKANPVERGKYLVRIYGCGDCHSPFTEEGRLMEPLLLAGGMKWTIGPYGAVTSQNLTSDKETGLGNWTDDEIKRGLTKGIRKDGSRSIPFPMPWTSYSNFKDDDLNAIIAYLRTLPPVYNKIPAPEPLNFFSYLWGKFKMLILKEDFLSGVVPGNSGIAKEKPMAAHKSANEKEAQQ